LTETPLVRDDGSGGAMRDEPIGAWLDELASAEPAPGGGAVAALQAALGAALLEMVCNLTVGKPAYGEHEDVLVAARREATELRAAAVRLANEDAHAFRAVVAAYKLPATTDGDKGERAARIQAALYMAADVPLRTAAVARGVLRLADSVLPGANVNVLSDVAVAAASARAALEAAIVNVEVNRAALDDPAERERLTSVVGGFAGDLDHATAVVAAVRERVGR
jgi:formiminotetrahydrofolate cyclodeaminase